MASLSLRTLLVLITRGAAPLLGADPDPDAGAARLPISASKGDFDYLLGEWKFTSVSKEWGRGQGYWTAVRLRRRRRYPRRSARCRRPAADLGLLHTLAGVRSPRWTNGNCVSSDGMTGLKVPAADSAAGAGDAHHPGGSGRRPQSHDLAHRLLRHHGGFGSPGAPMFRRGRWKDLGNGLPSRSRPERCSVRHMPRYS